MAKKKQLIRCGKEYVHENRLQKAKIIAEIVQKHYEPGRQDRCLEWIHKNIVNGQYPMSLRTFKRYIKLAEEHLGYCFAERSRDKSYLFDLYEKMQPETITRIEEVCREAQRTKFERKVDLCEDLQGRLGLNVSLQQISVYLLIGQHCMGYNIAY